uniref:NADH-ubiquinone oxidoreductase chain 4 n=1 Tax=Osphya bipunctata TaxID=1227470 RepID=S4SUR2_9CUCU|nr:NADH dehydrogenase subunit 4 [Osphya bipunctata]
MMKFIIFFICLIPLIFIKFLLPGSFFLVYWNFFFILNYCCSITFNLVSFGLGCELIAYLLVLLSMWICVLMILASEKIFFKKKFSEFFLMVILLLIVSLIIAFSALDLFIFYIFFEVSLVPTLFLILGWGYQPERLQAGIYLLFYTLFASLPMMIAIFWIYILRKNLDFFFLIDNFGLLMYMLMNLVFFIKIPMFCVHLWLPKAHVEAPVAGSMILAGIMLKLGSYGLMRVMNLFSEENLVTGLFFISLSLVGGFLVSLICLRQSDMKSLIAYSSVVHMGVVLCGVLTLNNWGFMGCLIMMIGHGLCSSGMFCLANISYERLNSRSLYLNKGLLNILPNLSLWWFLMISSNMAAPPSLNLLGEIFLMNSLISFSSLNMIFLGLISFFGAAYCLYLYSFSQHGKFNFSIGGFSSGNFREYLLLMLHWLPLNILILKGNFLIF